MDINNLAKYYKRVFDDIGHFYEWFGWVVPLTIVVRRRKNYVVILNYVRFSGLDYKIRFCTLYLQKIILVDFYQAI